MNGAAALALWFGLSPVLATPGGPEVASGFRVADARYVDSLGFLAALAYRGLGRADGALDPRSVRLYDRLVFPASRLLDRALHRVVGKNLLLRARRD